ncbi:NAD(P)H-dependent oxidoreductase, partial [Rhizobium ruizarguesonis]
DLRAKVLGADILLLSTPLWLGQPSRVCKRALERMDAFLEATDEEGRMVSYGRVAAVALVGNKDGAHHVLAKIFQALNDVGFTMPAKALRRATKPSVSMALATAAGGGRGLFTLVRITMMAF